jgi:peptide/nickel transport system substrate-binding protein
MRKLCIPLACLVVTLVVAGCGGGDDNGSTTSPSGTSKPAAGAKKGGTLTVMNIGDVDSLDPAYWYYQTDYQLLAETTQRGLYGWEADKTQPSPDLAEGMPELNGDTATIHIKKGIKYSPPYSKEVQAEDFKYAIERCFNPKFGNGYAGSYLSDIQGYDEVSGGKSETASGITATDPYTLTVKYKNPEGMGVLAQALALPCGVPIPKAYAAKYDASKNPTYGQHQLFLGPYMIQNDGKGNLTGYQPAKRIVLVRNPTWDKKSDYRPAYLDKIIVDEGNDESVASRRILQGESMINGDYAAPPPDILKQALSRYKDQVSVTPSQGNRYMAMNTRKAPLDNVNVRRAILAATDKTSLRLLRGGPVIGNLATHFIPPGISGFDEAGGLKGPGSDFASNPTANLDIAKKYMKAAKEDGVQGISADGRFSGRVFLMVGDNQGPAQKAAEAFKEQLSKLGFNIKLREVPHEIMYSKYCQVPKNQPDFCPSMGWGKDFFDGQSMIDPIYNSKNIADSGNANSSLVDDPKVDQMIAATKKETDPAARAKGWGDIDKYVTDQAYYDVWLWDNQVNIASKNVNVVLNKFNTSADLTYTSIK